MIVMAPCFFLLVAWAGLASTAQISFSPPVTREVEGVEVGCGSEWMEVVVGWRGGRFDGMIYPRGLARNSSCMAMYTSQPAPFSYRLPLSACNTMTSNMDDGTVEYYNTIVVQPHRKLVTSQGRGFHVRCRYTTREKLIANDINVNGLEAVTVVGEGAMPGCTMVIYQGDEVAQNVKIGEPLTLVVSIDQQHVYGMRLTDCSVTDATNSASQPLIDHRGCSVDPEIMGPFSYSEEGTKASVQFQAHKFPYTDSVYYHCNVHLCIKNHCPPVEDCSKPSRGGRSRRQSENEEGVPATIEVYSGLYVNEATDVAAADDLVSQRALDNPDNICISQRSFAIGIAVAGLVLMLLVIAAFVVLLARRRGSRKDPTGSVYSGPYTNTAYSHTS